MERKVARVRFNSLPTQPIKRVAAYARVSSGKDAMLHSLSAQVSYYSELIQSNTGWQYAGVYTDEAVTGTKYDRQAFQKLLLDCQSGKIDMVITKSISRFARNTVTLLETIRSLKEIGVDVYFEEQRIHTISPDGELMLSILASYAQEESLSVSENCKWYWRQRMKDGHMVGLREMFGYNIRRGIISVNEQEATIVRLVFTDYVNGGSTTAMARALEAAQVPRVYGGRWTDGRIRDMLKNEKYTGNALLQKKYVADHLTKRLVRNHGELAQYYVQGTHEAIIDEDTFARAQERLKANYAKANVKKPNTARYPLSSKIVCCNCGKHYSHRTSQSKVSWQCPTFLYEGKNVCPAKQIPEQTLYDLICEVLGLEHFDEHEFNGRILEIRVVAPNELDFVFSDGHTVHRAWKDRSRSESWTDEMKQAASERSKQMHENKRCKT